MSSHMTDVEREEDTRKEANRVRAARGVAAGQAYMRNYVRDHGLPQERVEPAAAAPTRTHLVPSHLQGLVESFRDANQPVDGTDQRQLWQLQANALVEEVGRTAALIDLLWPELMQIRDRYSLNLIALDVGGGGGHPSEGRQLVRWARMLSHARFKEMHAHLGQVNSESHQIIWDHVIVFLVYGKSSELQFGQDADDLRANLAWMLEHVKPSLAPDSPGHAFMAQSIIEGIGGALMIVADESHAMMVLEAMTNKLTVADVDAQQLLNDLGGRSFRHQLAHNTIMRAIIGAKDERVSIYIHTTRYTCVRVRHLMPLLWKMLCGPEEAYATPVRFRYDPVAHLLRMMAHTCDQDIFIEVGERAFIQALTGDQWDMPLNGVIASIWALMVDLAQRACTLPAGASFCINDERQYISDAGFRKSYPMRYRFRMLLCSLCDVTQLNYDTIRKDANGSAPEGSPAYVTHSIRRHMHAEADKLANKLAVSAQEDAHARLVVQHKNAVRELREGTSSSSRVPVAPKPLVLRAPVRAPYNNETYMTSDLEKRFHALSTSYRVQQVENRMDPMLMGLIQSFDRGMSMERPELAPGQAPHPFDEFDPRLGMSHRQANVMRLRDHSEP